MQVDRLTTALLVVFHYGMDRHPRSLTHSFNGPRSGMLGRHAVGEPRSLPCKCTCPCHRMVRIANAVCASGGGVDRQHSATICPGDSTDHP